MSGCRSRSFWPPDSAHASVSAAECGIYLWHVTPSFTESIVEQAALEWLRALGWAVVNGARIAPGEPRAERDDFGQAVLAGRLRPALERLNPDLPAEALDDAFRKLTRPAGTDLITRNRATHRLLVDGLTVEYRDASGHIRGAQARAIDFDNPHANDWLAVNQFSIVENKHARRFDVVLFVNGLPLAVQELKNAADGHATVWTAFQQIETYKAEVPSLFAHNAVIAISDGTQARVGTVTAGREWFKPWRTIGGQTLADGLAELQVVIEGLFDHRRFLDLVRDFIVFEDDGARVVKKMAGYHQFHAVRAAVEETLRASRQCMGEEEGRYEAGRKPGGDPGDRRIGVVWHTQGSGKSLTMLFLATKLRRSPTLQNPMIVVVTDRTQLDDQITRTFRQASLLEPERATNTRDLRALLSTNNGRTVMTTIQKFEEALNTPAVQREHLNDADNIIVMVDEAHRTQYGRLAAKMRAALPNATFVGFTGTPIDQGFKRTTMGTFGALIDSYTIPQSVEDGATVPIYYEARLPELHVEGPETVDRLFDALFHDEPEETRAEIRRRYANKETIAEAAKRIEAIALDIAEHFRKKVQPNGFKAQVVAPSRIAAARYAEHLSAFGLNAYPIITTTHNDGPEFKWARELPESQIVEDFKEPEGEPQILVVVDKLITGFDAPVEQVLYLDRSIREHTLLQAIARVNRRFSRTKDGVATEKTYGLVVDYHGVSRELESALAIFDRGDVEQALTELPEDPGPVIQAAADGAEAHFRGLNLDDAWACVHRFDPDASTEGDYKADQYERFDQDYRDFSTLMDRFLPEPAALAYLDRLRRLTVIRSYARALFLRERADIDWTAVGAKVKQLLDSRIDATVRELMAPVSVLDQDFEQKIARLPHDEARASVMEHAIRAQIKERVGENPVFYERLSEALERIIRELRARLIDAAEGCRRMAALRAQIDREEAIATEQGLTQVAFAVYELLERGPATGDGDVSGSQRVFREEPAIYRTTFDERLKDVARDVDAVLQKHRAIVDWQENLDVQREMRRDIKRILRDTGRYAESELDDIVRQVVEVARRRLS